MVTHMILDFVPVLVQYDRQRDWVITLNLHQSCKFRNKLGYRRKVLIVLLEEQYYYNDTVVTARHHPHIGVEW